MKSEVSCAAANLDAADFIIGRLSFNQGQSLFFLFLETYASLVGEDPDSLSPISGSFAQGATLHNILKAIPGHLGMEVRQLGHQFLQALDAAFEEIVVEHSETRFTQERIDREIYRTIGWLSAGKQWSPIITEHRWIKEILQSNPRLVPAIGNFGIHGREVAFSPEATHGLDRKYTLWKYHHRLIRESGRTVVRIHPLPAR